MMKRLSRSPYRNHIAIGHDTVMAALSFIFSLYLRLGSFKNFAEISYVPTGMLSFTAICLGVFLSMRHYRGMWRYASMQDLVAITKSVTLAIAIFVPVLFMFTRMDGYPRSALAINWMLLIVMLGAPRLLYRLIRDRNLSLDWRQLTDHRVPVLLIGAGSQAELFLRNSLQNREAPYRVVAILDDDASLQGRNLHGIKILGGTDRLEHIFGKLTRRDRRPHKIVLADPSLTGAKVRELLECAEALGVSIARVPSSIAALRSSHEPPAIAPIAIEDLLRRPQAMLDLQGLSSFLQNRRVLVTGAGGTIGSEIARQAANFAPASLLLLDHSEIALYTLDKSLESTHPSIPRTLLLADVRDRAYMRLLCQQHKPDVIFHAAAVKHVPLAESNPHEAVLTNIIGTRNVADAAAASGVGTMVMISTDKAVNPSSLMGATKRAAEYYCQTAGEATHTTRLMTVRFGNVLGSTGSVVPLFRQQLQRGGPLTVTHPEMTRYFMTVREAVELVLQAAASNSTDGSNRDTSLGNVSGQLFVLDMGDPVRILDLAEQMIRLADLRPYQDIKIELTGLRPGEKLYEELFYPDESPTPTANHSILRARLRKLDPRSVTRIIDLLEKAATTRETSRMFSLLEELVPEFKRQTQEPRAQEPRTQKSAV